MTRHVIILAQGQQTRLPELKIPKQLLPLIDCASVPILGRTMVQLHKLAIPELLVTVVCTGVFITQWSGSFAQQHPHVVGARDHLRWHSIELADPGNSSIKGISRYLDQRDELLQMDAWVAETLPSSTTVLLGDVCYSWDCLRELVEDRPHHPFSFVGTGNLSESKGELWGLQWDAGIEGSMIEWLKRALRKHPPVTDVYQCGQLRQWLFTARRAAEEAHASDTIRDLLVRYVPVDDYTKDFDTPTCLGLLGATARAAREDDERHGLVW